MVDDQPGQRVRVPPAPGRYTQPNPSSTSRSPDGCGIDPLAAALPLSFPSLNAHRHNTSPKTRRLEYSTFLNCVRWLCAADSNKMV